MAADPPQVRLGELVPGGIAPGIYALVERGAHRRPELAAGLRGVAELRYAEGFAPTRVSFGGGEIVVHDVDEAARRGGDPDVVVVAEFPVLVQLAAAPLAAGLPKLTSREGRAALATVAAGRIRVAGRRTLARRLLQLLEIRAE